MRKEELPKNWKTVKLGEVCEFSQGVQVDLELQSKEPKENYVKFLRIENYTQQSNDFRYIPIELSKNKTILKDDIVVVRYGASAGFIGRGFDGILANNLFKIDEDKNILDKNYLYLNLKSHKTYDFFQNAMFGGAMPALSFGIVSNLSLHLPPLPEQKRIAGCLSVWDKGIEKLKKLIDTKKRLKKGLMQILLKPFDEKDERQHSLPNWFKSANWKSVRLGEVGTFKTSSVDKLSHNDEISVKLLNYMDVYKRNYIRKTDIFQDITATQKEIETFDIKKGDVFFTPSSETRDDIGHSSVALDDLNNVLYSYHLIRFRPNKDIFDIGYLGYCFRTDKIYKELQIRAQGITRYTLSISAFNDIIAFLPPLAIQQKITAILSKADEEIELLQKKLENFNSQKKGLMQILLSVKVRFSEFI